MIEIIARLFKKRGEIDKSTVEVKLDIPALTQEEVFDEAVKEVTNQKLREIIIKSLTEACYDDETVKQTKDAAESELSTEDAKEKYPKAKFINCYGDGGEFFIRFELERFVEQIIKNN